MFGFLEKQCPENFTFLVLKIIELFEREVFIFFVKSRLLFNISYCFFMFVNKRFYISDAYMSKSQRCYNAKRSPYYFYVKTKISVDFHICISVPLNTFDWLKHLKRFNIFRKIYLLLFDGSSAPKTTKYENKVKLFRFKNHLPTR